jgi:uncharacterized protein (TIGR02271 family)
VSDPSQPAGVTGIDLHEERLAPRAETFDAGSIRARKQVDHVRAERQFSTNEEDAHVERLAAAEGDSGQVETLPDGSISIPLFEERLVVEKRLFVKERIIVRKQVAVRDHKVSADLASERLVIDADDSIADRVVDGRGANGATGV